VLAAKAGRSGRAGAGRPARRGGMTRAQIQFVRQYTPVLKGRQGETYVARAYMDRQPGGLWEAWLVFFSLCTGRAIATDRETTQGKREHILYWATGLGPTYLQGALDRALALEPETQLARRISRAERHEAYALLEAEVYAAATASALRRAAAARDRVTRGAQ
jgi:hypothetical protein